MSNCETTAWEEIRDDRLEEHFFRCKHKSGLEIQVLPKPGYESAYALLSTKYGSVDTTIIQPDGTAYEIPEGTAHFLEHKLFESEDLDAFARFAKTGASANAHTGFERTAYLFNTSGNFDANLEILLDFVRHPYFSEATVQKEQGIIGQEIRMYKDEPGWEVMFRLLQALYATHPVRIDIAGTEESISHITAAMLYDCYRNFYNLHNMVLTVAGGITPEQVLAVADKLLPEPEQGQPAKRKKQIDLDPPQTQLTERQMEVETPHFSLGYKEIPGDPEPTLWDVVLSDLILDTIAGEFSPLYETLLNEGLISGELSYEYFVGCDYACCFFESDSKEPKTAAEKIISALQAAKTSGLPADGFERARRRAYGTAITQFNNVSGIAERMGDLYFSGYTLFDKAAVLRTVTLEEGNKRLQTMFRVGFEALSVISPKQK